ncbi:hypothetical protein N7519_000550 [Penicillium mononematosum]|uniref:uncharacterized protein n=1 Tax=Penicillium mononematosum TaxID=268346 RepID=UPI00254854B9|nr:uncharacterized protein N7519_000550 [Penicillium mononematosum]KAJ6190529.1 hypothetical protein N7519_000550 [Penicillium mononematosum]
MTSLNEFKRVAETAGRKGISTGLPEGLLKNDSRTMATESSVSSRSHDSSGTLGCFLNLKRPSSDEWRTFALTCSHVVVPPSAGLSHEDKKPPWDPEPQHDEGEKMAGN